MSELMNIRDQYLNGAKKIHKISYEIIQKKSTKISKKEIKNYKGILAHSYAELLNNDSIF